MDPIVECGTPFDFYRLDDSLRVDIDDFRKSLAHCRIGVVVLVHYNGFPDPNITNIVEICRSHNVLLVEDCSHCPPDTHSAEGIGTYGQYAIYSAHKYLPVRDGGLLRDNGVGPVLPEVPTAARISLDSLEVLHRSNLTAIAMQRRANYEQLRCELSDMRRDITMLVPDPPMAATPHNFPLLLRAGTRHAVFQSLMKQSVRPISLYYRLVPQIAQCYYPSAHYVAARIINLPIHQDLTSTELTRIAQAFRVSHQEATTTTAIHFVGTDVTPHATVQEPSP
jgi:dTDP-4-amino-4,6-dideoxygalactose transaminase